MGTVTNQHINLLTTNALNTFAEKATAFFLQLQPPVGLPTAVEVLNPYQQSEIQAIVRRFYEKFFNDTAPRVFLLGINPGRFGGGTTGIAFTDPNALRTYCNIENTLTSAAELSSKFVYRFINAFGGAEAFYQRFYLGALYPLALIKNGKNYNYYDELGLFELLKPHIVHTLQGQINFNADRRAAICLGQKNAGYLRKLNEAYGFFEKIISLDHPRYIMQYKTRQVEQYVAEYLRVLEECL